MKNIVCIIPARGNSERVSNKNIRLLLGKPLIAYTIESALESRLISKTIVSTDSQVIAKIAKEFGAEVVLRPDNLALPTSPLEDALRHAVGELDRKEGFRPDIVVFMQPNVPVRKSGEIDVVIKRLQEIKDATAMVTVYKINQRPEWMKRLDKKTGRITPFIEPTMSYRMQDLPELYLIDGAIVLVKTNTLMETEGNRKAHAFLGDKVYSFIHDARYSVEIDEEEDFEIAKYFLLKERNK